MKFFNKDKIKEENKIKTYNEDGYDQDGYDINGYDIFGYDRNGWNKEGYNKEGFDHDGYNRNGYDKEGYDRDGLDMYGMNHEGYDKLGYDRFGFNKEGYNKNGYDKYGYNKEGYNSLGFDKEGFNKEGFNKYGEKKSEVARRIFDPNGYDQYGYDKEGYDKEGYNKHGFNRDGYDKLGFNSLGFNKDNIHKNGTKYDDLGYDYLGFNEKGYNRLGYDKNGIHESLAPRIKEFKMEAKKSLGKMIYHEKYGEGKITSITPKEDFKSGYAKVLFAHGIKKEFLWPDAIGNFLSLDVLINKDDSELSYSEKEFKKEKKYLSKVLEYCNSNQEREYKAPTLVRDNSWNNPYDDDYDFQDTENYFYNISMKDYWNKVSLSPFFGSFIDKNGLKYIGKEEIEGFVYDWRSKEASTYYVYRSILNSDLELSLVRNHTIEYKRYKSFIDLFNKEYPNSITLATEDEYLSRILIDSRLSKETHDIINSIQKKQYEIISNLNNENILVNGCAGSGKTMVLFHKIAYMAFNLEKFNPSECLVISSNILLKREGDLLARELKLDKIRNYSLEEFYDSLIDSIIKPKNINIDYTFKPNNLKAINLYSDKALKPINLAFKEFLLDSNKIYQEHLNSLKRKEEIFKDKSYLEDVFNIFKDIPFMNLLNEYNTIDIIKLKNLFKDSIEYNDNGSLKKKYKNSIEFKELLDKDSNLLNKAYAYMNYKNEIKNYDLYKEGKLNEFIVSIASYFLNKEIKYSYNLLDYKFLILYLIKDYIKDYPFTNRIFIDEYQNYSLVELNLLKELYPYATFNFFGDIKQRIDASGIKSSLELPFICKSYELNVNYRSAKEVCWYLNKKYDTNMVPIGISGIAEEKNIVEKLYIDEENDRCALIVKNLEYTKDLSSKDKCKFINILKKDKIDKKFINILLVDDVKGLEFEKVYVYPKGMSKEEEYLASSRALRHLVILKG